MQIIDLSHYTRISWHLIVSVDHIDTHKFPKWFEVKMDTYVPYCCRTFGYKPSEEGNCA